MSNDQESKNIEFHYEKSGAYKTVHADGVYGGLTPSGNLYIAFFNERSPTSKKEIIDFATKEVKEREGKQGVFREIDVGIVMNYGVMIALRDWLNRKIAQYEDQVLPKSERPKTH